MIEYGLQMYSVRDLTKIDLEDALSKVAELGYSFVEFAGFFGHSAKDVRRMLDNYGLRISGTHTGIAELTPDRLAETVAYHKELGNTNIILPSADMRTPEKLDAVIALINDVQPKLALEGITLSYHNHDDEFVSNGFGVITHRELEIRTEIEFEIDTYWVYAAHQDPVKVLERLRDRIRVIHLKDGFADRRGMPLGEGTAPVEAVRAYALANGITMIVESETCQPSGLEEAGRCIRFLRSLEK